MISWEKSDCSPDWTELLSILADLAKLTEKCSKNCGLLPQWNVFQKHQSQNAICISKRHFFSNPGFTYFLLHFATQMSFLLLSLFLFQKMWKLIFLLSPSHFRAWLSQILSRARDMGRVCGNKYKNRLPIK